MKYLITGGAGFIGSHVVDRLVAEGEDVYIIDNFNDYYSEDIKLSNISGCRDKITLFRKDIRDLEALEDIFAEVKPDILFHFAARAGVRPSIENPELYISVNINGTFNLLKCAQKSGVKRVVFASSSSVYGINKKIPFAEDDTIYRTISPYAATKLAAEQICSNFSYLYNMRIICLRFFTVYGPRQRPDLAIAKFVKLIDEGKEIPRYGKGDTGRDYTYIDDIVQGIFQAIRYDKANFDIFNLGESKPVLLNDLIQVIEKQLGKKAKIKQLPEQPGDVPITYADISKSTKLLNYQPCTDIETGIKKYVAWYTASSKFL